jgi:hypothetical protein
VADESACLRTSRGGKAWRAGFALSEARELEFAPLRTPHAPLQKPKMAEKAAHPTTMLTSERLKLPSVAATLGLRLITGYAGG